MVMTPNNEAAGSGTGKHRHGVATKALKVFLGTAAVAGSIWGVTSAAKAKGSARNNAAALLMKSKATKAPTVMTKAPKEPKGGKEEVSKRIGYDLSQVASR